MYVGGVNNYCRCRPTPMTLLAFVRCFFLVFVKLHILFPACRSGANRCWPKENVLVHGACTKLADHLSDQSGGCQLNNTRVVGSTARWIVHKYANEHSRCRQTIYKNTGAGVTCQNTGVSIEFASTITGSKRRYLDWSTCSG